MKLNRVGKPKTHLTPRERLAEQKKETARRRAFEKHARQERAQKARAKAGEDARRNDATGCLQAMYDAFIPENRTRGITSKYVTDVYGNRIKRTEVTV